MDKYYSRYIEKIIEKKLKSSGCVVVAGPKFCGKSTTSSMFSKSVYKISTKAMVKYTKLNPNEALVGENPHMVDEWQKVPEIWNLVKDDLDKKYIFGKYILTGSSTPADESMIEHDGSGRIITLNMKPLCLYETGESKGKASLKDIFEGKNVSDLNSDYSLKDTAFYVCRGGWPLSLYTNDRDVALDITRNYYDGLFTFDDCDNERFRNRKPEVLRALIRSYARNISTEASYKTIINDVKDMELTPMSENTFYEYNKALKDLYIINDIDAWTPNIRSKTAIVSTPTRHFVDTSIACQALRISPNDLLNDLKSFGYFFEDFAVNELRTYAMVLNGEIRHYRDNAGLECDAILKLFDGRYGAIEIKLGGDELIEYGASKLKILYNKIKEKSNEKLPSFMMILTACGQMYRREDGIYVVPINMLKD